MKVIIAGGRNITNIACVRGAVANSGFEVTEIISGGAAGVDTLGETYGKQEGIPVRIFPADWSLGRKAGPLRNATMAQNADALILVWDGKSRGSASMKREARKHGLRVFEWRVAEVAA